MNGRNDEREVEDDGFYSVNFDERAYDAAKERWCPKCGGTGYRRDWRGACVQCDDCWSDNGPTD